LSQQSPDNFSQSLRVTALLAVLYGLIGEVSHSLRAVRIKWGEKTIYLYFFYDGEISEEDCESAECIATEVISNFSEHTLEVNILRWDHPKQIPNEGELVYKRREPRVS
jgi:hypothetical protein